MLEFHERVRNAAHEDRPRVEFRTLTVCHRSLTPCAENFPHPREPSSHRTDASTPRPSLPAPSAAPYQSLREVELDMNFRTT